MVTGIRRAKPPANAGQPATTGGSGPPTPGFLKAHEKGVTVKVKVTPNSSKNGLSFENEEHVSVKLTCPPVEGRANKELTKLMAKRLKVPPSSISILHGLTSREKILLIPGLTAAEVMDRLSG
jgi:uncharacterized protein (TIGR00251 family)